MYLTSVREFVRPTMCQRWDPTNVFRLKNAGLEQLRKGSLWGHPKSSLDSPKSSENMAKIWWSWVPSDSFCFHDFIRFSCWPLARFFHQVHEFQPFSLAARYTGQITMPFKSLRFKALDSEWAANGEWLAVSGLPIVCLFVKYNTNISII